MLLTTPQKKLADNLGYALERMEKHERNEAARRAGGLETDMERWEKRGTALD